MKQKKEINTATALTKICKILFASVLDGIVMPQESVVVADFVVLLTSKLSVAFCE